MTTTRPEPRRASDPPRSPRQASKGKRDYLTWILFALFLGLLAAPIVIARHGTNRYVVAPFLFAALGVGVGPLESYLEGRARSAVATASFMGCVYGMAITWKATFPYWTWLVLAMVSVWGIVLIGAGQKRSSSKVFTGRRAADAVRDAARTRKDHAPTAPPRVRAERRARHWIAKAASKHLPPEVEWGDIEVTKLGVSKVKFFLPSGSPHLTEKDRAELARNISKDMTKVRGMVTVDDLGASLSEGWYLITIREHRPWTGPREDTDHHDLIGHDDGGAAVMYDARVEGAEHVLLTGASGMGKSNGIEVMMGVHWHRRARFRIVDAKGGSSLFDWQDHGEWATTPAAGARLIIETAVDVLTRNAENGRLRRKMTTEDPIVLVVDEVDAVIDEPGVAEAWKSILKRGRSANVHVVAATVSARVDIMGGGDAKAQFVGPRFAFHTDTDEENRIALGVLERGFKTNKDLTVDDLGKCIVRNFPGRGLFFMKWKKADPPPPLDDRGPISQSPRSPADGRPPMDPGQSDDREVTAGDRLTEVTGPVEREPERPTTARYEYDDLIAALLDENPCSAPAMALRVRAKDGRTPSKNTCREALDRLVLARRAARLDNGRFPTYVHPALAQARDVLDAAGENPDHDPA